MSQPESYRRRAYSRDMPEIHEKRRQRVQDAVRELGVDAVLVTVAPNVRYLTGLASSNAAGCGKRPSRRTRPEIRPGLSERSLAASLDHRGRTGKLSDRVPVTVEPGVYLPGKGGVRIEDVLVVTASGGARLLTSTTRELLVL